MDRAIIVCTPYSVRAGIVEKLLDELRNTIEYKIILRKRARLNVADVRAMYPQLVSAPFFPRIIECLTEGDAEYVLIMANRIHKKINAVKGKFRYDDGKILATGLRAKLQKDDKSFEFIFHSTDSNDESDKIGIRLFGRKYAVAKTILQS